MANYCEYKVIVKGKKNGCYAFFGSTSCLDDKYVVEESGTDDEYIMRFEGNCKWAIDAYCTPWNGEFPVELPEDYEEAYQTGEDLYWYNTVYERSMMFGVEVICNSADVEDYDPAEGPCELYEHYKDGKPIWDECPPELRIKGYWDEEDCYDDVIDDDDDDDANIDLTADLCQYKVVVKGKENACYAFFGSMPYMNEREIIDSFGTEEEFELHFKGSCDGAVDEYCTPWDGDFPVELPEDCGEACEDAESFYCYKTVSERSRMFDVEVLCNSIDRNNCAPDTEPEEIYVHYKNGEQIFDECPQSLRFCDEPQNEPKEAIAEDNAEEAVSECAVEEKSADKPCVESDLTTEAAAESEVEQSQPKTPTISAKKKFPWWLVIVIVVIFLAASAAGAYFGGLLG